jgi:hypothetical protein
MRTADMGTADIYVHLADLAVAIEKQIRAPGQLPSNRAHLRMVHSRITDALGSMGLVQYNANLVSQQAAC